MADKIVITIPLEGNEEYLEDGDFRTLIKESRNASWIEIEVGRQIGEVPIRRSFSISAENFEVIRIDDGKDSK